MGSEREYDENGLNEKQRLFCDNYLIDLNATQSAIRAGYSEKSAHSIGSELLNKPEVQKYIADLKAIRSKRTEVTADRVIEELAKIAFSDIRQFYNEHGALKLPHEMSAEDASALAGMEVDELFGFVPGADQKEKIGETKKIRLYDKVRALEHLGKHTGIFEKHNSQKKADIITPETLVAIADKINKNAAG